MRKIRQLILKLRSQNDGSVAIIAATCGMLIVASIALVVDAGFVFSQSRKLQGMADLAAIASARNLEMAQAAADATVSANGWDGPVSANVALGAYSHTKTVARGSRFVAGAPSPNATRVELSADANLFFGRAILGKNTITLRRQATAARAELATFSIASRLASLNDGAANALLGALTGSEVKLSVMDYNALAGANVDLFRYVDALRTSASLEGASFNEALASNISTGQALSVLSDLVRADGDTKAAVAITKLAVAAGTGQPARLDKMIDLGPIGDQDRLLAVKSASVDLKAMDVADALLLVAQEGRQVKLDMGASLPGLTDVDVWLAIGERPNNSAWVAVDDDGGVTIRTAQTRLYLEAKALSLLAILGGKPVTLPILIEAASAEAKLAAINCPLAAEGQSVTLNVRPSLGRIVVGQIDKSKLNNFKQPLAVAPAEIVSIPLVKATGSAEVNIGGHTWSQVRFNASEIQARAVKSVSTTDIAQATLSSLLDKLTISATVAGITTPAVGLSLGGTVKAMASPLDKLVNDLTALLGVRLGEGEVQINGLRCRDAALVA